MRNLLLMLFCISLPSPSYAQRQSVLVKRYGVDQRLLGGTDLSDYLSFKGSALTYKNPQPALMMEQNDFPTPNTNYFTISFSSQTAGQDTVLKSLQGKGIIWLWDSLELIYLDGQVVDVKHTEYFKPVDWTRNWAQVEVSSK